MNNSSSPSLSGSTASQPTSPVMAPASMLPSGGIPLSSVTSSASSLAPAQTLAGLSPACAAYSGSMLAGTYPRLAADSMYGSPYAAAVQSAYAPLTDPSAFYSPLVSQSVLIRVNN